MSHYGKNMKVKKTVVVSCFGKNYVTSKGLGSVLADQAASRVLERIRFNVQLYGTPNYSKRHENFLALWRKNHARVRAKFYRRALPILKKLFEEE